MVKKELQTFFSSPIGYMVIGLFILFNGLFLFVFKTDFNILNAGFADLNSFFYITPWFFIFLIPAITMRSFSDEIAIGTIEILKTKPIEDWKIILGKYFGALLLICLALIPTLIYVFSIYKLGNPVGNIDFATTIGSYIGLLFLASSFVAIGLFTSTFAKNQIVAFLLAVFISFLAYYGFEFIADSITTNTVFIQKIGMYEHFQNLSRGLIDTRDILYFLSVTGLFIELTQMRLKQI